MCIRKGLLATILTLIALLAVSGCVSTPLQNSEGIAWCIGNTPTELVGKEVSFIVRNELDVPISFDLFLLKTEIGRGINPQKEFLLDNVPKSYLKPNEECTVRIFAHSGFLKHPRMFLFRKMSDAEIQQISRLKGAREIGLECMKQDGQIYLERRQLIKPNTIELIVIRKVLGGDIYHYPGANLPVD
jgi:hypothetical protein